jgi:GNAT superfamily N-acetyltransferase
MRRADPTNIPTLIALMVEFYAESGFELDRRAAESAFGALLADERLGSVWLIESEGEVAGHLVLTSRFGMEFAGLVACVDDLYVRPAFRGRKLATAALLEARETCARLGVRAMTVEVGRDNPAAEAAYRRAGFAVVADRQLLALALAPPAHVV